MKGVTAHVNIGALEHNVARIRQMAPQSRLVAVVKANAYGHGLRQVARALDPLADAFAVSRIGEALELREDGCRKPIVLLEGFYNDADVQLIAEHGLYTAVHDSEQLRAITEQVTAKPVHAWVKADIGMHRLGSDDLGEIAHIKSSLEQCAHVHKPVGLIAHLSVADTPQELEYHQAQMQRFFEIARQLKFDPDSLCLANSAGICRWPESHTAWVRPGIILYGISPFGDVSGGDLGLRPVMTLKTSLIAMHRVKAGAKIGYGAWHVAPHDTVLGIVAAGYGDGYPRSAPVGTPVLINGREAGTAGHVCMDMLFVDLGPDSHDQIGDEVTLWGEGLPVERVAAGCGTIPYELVCRVMPRVSVEFD